jgi:hypothetical protein
MTTVPRTAPEGGSKRLFAVLLHTLAIAVLANAFRLLEQVLVSSLLRVADQPRRARSRGPWSTLWHLNMAGRRIT